MDILGTETEKNFDAKYANVSLSAFPLSLSLQRLSIVESKASAQISNKQTARCFVLLCPEAFSFIYFCSF